MLGKHENVVTQLPDKSLSQKPSKLGRGFPTHEHIVSYEGFCEQRR